MNELSRLRGSERYGACDDERGGESMADRKRGIVLRVPVTAEERALIEQKMKLLHTGNFSA